MLYGHPAIKLTPKSYTQISLTLEWQALTPSSYIVTKLDSIIKHSNEIRAKFVREATLNFVRILQEFCRNSFGQYYCVKHGQFHAHCMLGYTYNTCPHWPLIQ